jgi:hypothetical protein
MRSKALDKFKAIFEMALNSGVSGTVSTFLITWDMSG